MSALPEKYKWLENIGVLPKLIAAAIQYLGVREIPGPKSNPVIIDMAKGLGLGKIYTNDDTEWCALFINHLMRIVGKPLMDIKGNLYNYLRSLYLLNWGEEVKIEDACLGDVVILKRTGGGHVFLLIAFTPGGNPVGIGGNQSNKVSIAEFDKSRIVGIRRYYSIAKPESAKRYVVDSDGLLSTNEA